MKQLVTIDGVAPHGMARLHELLDGPGIRGKDGHVYVSLKDARWEQHGHYKVELECPTVIRDGDRMYYAPFSVLKTLYRTIGDFYPDKEMLVEIEATDPSLLYHLRTFQQIRMTGLAPEHLDRLFNLKHGPHMQSQYWRKPPSTECGFPHEMDIPYILLRSAGWEAATKTIRADLVLPITELALLDTIQCYPRPKRNALLYAPIAVLEILYRILQYYPAEEKMVSTSKEGELR